jgi:hypothetical protein
MNLFLLTKRYAVLIIEIAARTQGYNAAVNDFPRCFMQFQNGVKDYQRSDCFYDQDREPDKYSEWHCGYKEFFDLKNESQALVKIPLPIFYSVHI